MRLLNEMLNLSRIFESYLIWNCPKAVTSDWPVPPDLTAGSGIDPLRSSAFFKVICGQFPSFQNA